MLLAVVLYVALILLLCILFIPVEYQSNGYFASENQGISAQIRGLFGWITLEYTYAPEMGQKMELIFVHLFKKKINFQGRQGKRSKKNETNGVEKKEGDGRKYRLTLEGLEMVFRSIKRVLAAYKPTLLKVDCTIGFEDSYHTGLLCGGLQAIYPGLQKLGHVRIVPVFDDEYLEGSFSLAGRIILAVAVIESLRLYFLWHSIQILFNRTFPV